MSESIFSYLTSYIPTDKRESKEDYLTQMFAWMLNNIEEYAREYVLFLSKKNDKIVCPSKNEMNISASTQEILPSGRVDLLIRVNRRIGFICEHKIHSILSENQIKKYIDNSDLLGMEKNYSVLVTFSSTQHTQPADVSITWSDVCEFTEDVIGSFENEEAFILNQFVLYLKENGMGKAELITPESMLGYWAAIGLEDNLSNLFMQLSDFDWKKECLFLNDFSASKYAPTYHKTRWGRLGIDFFDSWEPGLFAGVMLHTGDHQLQPKDIRKGPDFVIFLESEYHRKDEKKMKIYGEITNSTWYANKIRSLQLNSGSFEFIPGLEKSPWRIAVLRKPLLEVLGNAYTRAEQLEAVKNAIIEGINLMTKSEQKLGGIF